MHKELEKEIKRIVNKYSHWNSTDFFKVELEYLVTLAEKLQTQKLKDMIGKY